MKTKLRRITVADEPYRWSVSSPDEDYGVVNLRVWCDKTVILDVWLRREYQPVTPKFVAEHIGYRLKPVEFQRAAGECVCGTCGAFYRDHPYGGPLVTGYAWEPSRQWLHRLCDGSLVKL